MNENDSKLKIILEQLTPFGFEYYGSDENGIPLVKGPNSQIVEINVAINFVNKQIAARENSSGGSPEQMPTAEGIEQPSNFERGTEQNIEKANEVEKLVEDGGEKVSKTQGQGITQSPKITIAKTAIKPYGDGFEPKLFDPTDLKSTLEFVERNSKISHTSSNRWLAEQFRKFIAEFNAQKK